MRNHLFFSYAHADRAFVERLAQDLRNQGHVVWIDIEGIRGGDVWRQAIADGVFASAIVLVAVSPDSVKSEWVKIEIDAARTYGKKIVPLLVRPLEKAADRAANKRLGLETIQYIDFTQGFDPGLRFLLLPDVLPRPQAGIAGHCQKIIAQLASRPWGLDHYIQSPAKLLPIDASPYEDGAIKGNPERLLELLGKGERLLILGEPGMGKTVALERLAWELACNVPLILPIFVALRDYDGGALLDWIRLSLVMQGEIKLKTLEETSRFLDGIPFQVYFLLDGLNEVSPAYRDKVLNEIKRLSMEFPGPHFRLAVTSRVQDESWRILRHSDAVHETYLVQPIRPEQARGYLQAHLGSDELWNRLDSRMQGLASNPLLLWLIKEASLNSPDIPGNRGALYRNFVERMLNRDIGKVTIKVPEEQRLAALERLALHMSEKQLIALPHRQALAEVGDEQLLEALCVNGFLTGDRIVRFAPHQTIQEHFAARALEAKLEDTKTVERNILDKAREPWWAETFIQLAGLITDPNTLTRALAKVNPWLAWWCVEEGQEVDPTTRQVIEAGSIALTRSPNISDRRSAAQVLAKLGSEHTVDPLLKLAEDEDEEVGEIALAALKPFGEAIIPRLVPPLTDTTLKPRARARIGRLIGKIGDPRRGVGLQANGLPDIKWCEVSAGEIVIGSEQDSDNPVRTLTLPTYWISRYPITDRQYQAFLDAEDGYRSPQWWARLHPGGLEQQQGGPREQHFKYGNHPREYVSWYEAMAFCRWLSAKLGYEIRLPTEEEWEKAARGTEGRIYPYGNVYDPARGNTGETGIGMTSAVGIFPDGTSPYGVMDLSGNVLEWCLNEYESGKVNVGSNEWRTLRGGSWLYDQHYSRALVRSFSYPASRGSYLGFRVAGVGRPPSS